MANRIRLEPGRYKADTLLTVMLMHRQVEKEYEQIGVGKEFVIPETKSGYWYAVVYHPDFGDKRPAYRKVE